MAHSNGKIYRDTEASPIVGIDALADVAVVTGHNTGDWGQLCGDVDEDGVDVNMVNPNSVHKPVRSALKGGTEQQVKAASKYGWQIDQKTTNVATSSFIQQLKTQGAQYSHWTWLKPRGRSYGEEFRIMDFDGYDQNQLPYRTPCFFSRLSATELNISGTHDDIVIPKQQTKSQTINSSTFSLNGAYDVTVLVSIIDPDPSSAASYMNWDVDGSFDVSLVDANGIVVDHDYQTGFGVQTGNIPQTVSLHFESFHSLDGYTGPFHIEYRVYFENNSYFFNGSSNEYVPVTVRVETTYAATLTSSRTGQDGVVIRPAGQASEWTQNGYRARAAVFGNDHWPMAVIEVSNGSQTQSKIVSIPSSGFIPFKRIGITVVPRQQTDSKDIIVYLLYGNIQTIFPEIQTQVDYGDLSLADSHVLICAPNCYNELGIIASEPQPMVVYSDDFQGGVFYYKDGTSQNVSMTTADGFVPGVEKLLDAVTLRWDFGIDNIPVDMPVVVTMIMYDAGDDSILEEHSLRYTAPAGNAYIVHTEFSFTSGIDNYMPFEVYVKMFLEVNGDVYYVKFYPQVLSTSDQGPYYLGVQY